MNLDELEPPSTGRVALAAFLATIFHVLAKHAAVDFLWLVRALAGLMIRVAAAIQPSRHRDRYREEWLGERDALYSAGETAPLFYPLLAAASLLISAPVLRLRLLQAEWALVPVREPVPRRATSPTHRRWVIVRRRRMMRRVVLGLWIACVLGAAAGIPLANVSLVRANQLLEDFRKFPRGIEASEVQTDLMRHRL